MTSSPFMMNPYSIPTLLTSLLSLFLGGFVLSKNKKSALHRTFALWCFLTAYWQGIWTVLFNIHSHEAADTLVRLGYSGIIFIPILFFHFVVEFTHSGSKRRLSRWFYIFGAGFLLSVWTTDAFIEGVYIYFWGFYPKVGPLHVVYLVTLSVMLFTGLGLLLHYRRELSGQPVKVNQVSYVFVSTVTYSLAATDFLANYGLEFYPLGFIFTNIHAGLIAYAIIQFRLLEIDLIIRKSLIYVFLLLVLLLPCYLLVVWGEMVAFGEIHYPFSLIILVLFIVVGFLFPKLRFLTEEAFERVLFKRRYDYRDTLLRSIRDMVSIVELDAVSNNLVQTVVKALRIDRASLYLLDDLKGNFGMKSSFGLVLNSSELPVLRREDPLVRKLTSMPGALVREELEMAGNEAATENLARQMGEMRAEVTLPLVAKERVIGLLNLGYKEGNEMYSDEDLELLSTLANQAAIAIENARLYENLKQSQSIIRRGDRLASLGQLTAGLAHEIRNPLVAIRTFTQLLPERYQDPDFRSNFQALAMKEVERICGLVNDLLSFARPSAPNVSAESINEIVESIARILETEAKEKGVQIYRRLAASLPKIFVDKEQIKQVCMNVILNAIQAIDGRGVVQVSTLLFAKNGGEQFVQIGIRDSGIGIADKDLENIFNPFYTTKKEGSGLGLSISHQIVQEHGGYIVVESNVGEGTTFFINLPVSYQNHQGVRGGSHLHEEDPGR